MVYLAIFLPVGIILFIVILTYAVKGYNVKQILINTVITAVICATLSGGLLYSLVYRADDATIERMENSVNSSWSNLGTSIKDMRTNANDRRHEKNVKNSKKWRVNNFVSARS